MFSIVGVVWLLWAGASVLSDKQHGGAREFHARAVRVADATGRRKVSWRMGSAADTQHAILERATLQAIKDWWPGRDGVLASADLLTLLAERVVATPARALYLLLESLQMRGSLRLSRGNPDSAAREAHGARHIRRVNPALLDSPPA